MLLLLVRHVMFIIIIIALSAITQNLNEIKFNLYLYNVQSFSFIVSNSLVFVHLDCNLFVVRSVETWSTKYRIPAFDWQQCSQSSSSVHTSLKRESIDGVTLLIGRRWRWRFHWTILLPLYLDQISHILFFIEQFDTYIFCQNLS